MAVRTTTTTQMTVNGTTIKAEWKKTGQHQRDQNLHLHLDVYDPGNDRTSEASRRIFLQVPAHEVDQFFRGVMDSKPS